MGLKFCQEDLLTYVACNESYRYFFQIIFLHIIFYKNVARLVLEHILGEKKVCFPRLDIQKH